MLSGFCLDKDLIPEKNG